MQSQLMSAAVEIPVRDQPIDVAMGCRNTVSEAIAPNPTQVTAIPRPTMIQPKKSFIASAPIGVAHARHRECEAVFVAAVCREVEIVVRADTQAASDRALG